MHRIAYLHLLRIALEAWVRERRNPFAWFQSIHSRKSFSGQDLVAYELMPSLDDIRVKRLRDVVFTDD